MKVTLARDVEAARNKTYQDPFKAMVTCPHCGKEAPLAFVAHEGLDEDDRDTSRDAVCSLYKTTGQRGDGLWLHDWCAVAVYFCRGCLKPLADYNQG